MAGDEGRGGDNDGGLGGDKWGWIDERGVEIDLGGFRFFIFLSF